VATALVQVNRIFSFFPARKKKLKLFLSLIQKLANAWNASPI